MTMRGRKILMKKMQKSHKKQALPSSSPVLDEEEEEEDEDEEELDLEDQDSEDVIADDVEDEDPSLWFSTSNITSAPTMKGISINEAWGRQHDKALDTSTQGKQKGIDTKGNLKLLSPSEGEVPSQVLVSGGLLRA
ncbi:hypothetical protein L6452_25780 [Arctium lappa]|uniref:Uncharacterized protein n=1 Tax=Arctium lappa TaxID=4217 RepID=A0ACB9AC80_ARCLA|nr:hypothetical protein L6452_25780 [Arctium lappa]